MTVRRERASGIDGDALERMATVARNLPGRTVSVAARRREERDRGAPRPSGVWPAAALVGTDVELHIDGVAAEEILARCYDIGEIAG
jgi:hypothetical protein